MFQDGGKICYLSLGWIRFVTLFNLTWMPSHFPIRFLTPELDWDFECQDLVFYSIHLQIRLSLFWESTDITDLNIILPVLCVQNKHLDKNASSIVNPWHFTIVLQMADNCLLVPFRITDYRVLRIALWQQYKFTTHTNWGHGNACIPNLLLWPSKPF